jgi:hypothetical protein
MCNIIEVCMFQRWLSSLILCFPVCMASIDAGAKSMKVQDIPEPEEYRRITAENGSFGEFLKSLPLKNIPSIKCYNGSLIDLSVYSVFYCVDIPLLFRKDIEQCADWGMRLWAEYHRSAKKLDSFYLLNYSGSKEYFRSSGKTFSRFLEKAFISSNSFSLKNGCLAIIDEKLMPGDMFVQNENGGIGHVSMVIDSCEDRKGRRLYLIGFSFMPAQEFHIEKGEGEYGVDGWFSRDGYIRYLEKYYPYGKPVIRRFEPGKTTRGQAVSSFTTPGHIAHP